MQPILSLLAKKGLTNRERVERDLLHQWSIPKIEALADELYQTVSTEDEKRSMALTNADKDTFNAFTFVASLSLSGVVGCFALDCRINRPQKLARYAALYADNVIAPIELTNPHKHQRPHGPKQEDDFRYHMTGTVLALLEMAPAIKASLISITTPELHFCAACAANASRRIQRINAAAQKLAEAKRRHFSVCCERLAPIPILHVHGPAEYCEHEDFFRVYRQTPKWLNTKLGKHMLGISLPPSVLKQSGIVDSLFRDVAWQVTLQEYLGLQYKAKTVTSNPGELALLSRLNPAHGVHSRATAALSQITHALPLMEEISLTKAIQLRNAENDAFVVYRKALSDVVGELLRETEPFSEKRAFEIVSEVL